MNMRAKKPKKKLVRSREPSAIYTKGKWQPIKRMKRVSFRATVTHSRSVRWDEHGRCFESLDDGPEQERPDLAFGTPMGDLLIAPWIQAIVRKK